MKLKAMCRRIWIPEITIGDLVSPIPRSDPARVWITKTAGRTALTIVRYCTMRAAAWGASGGITNFVAG